MGPLQTAQKIKGGEHSEFHCQHSRYWELGPHQWLPGAEMCQAWEYPLMYQVSFEADGRVLG